MSRRSVDTNAVDATIDISFVITRWTTIPASTRGHHAEPATKNGEMMDNLEKVHQEDQAKLVALAANPSDVQGKLGVLEKAHDEEQVKLVAIETVSYTHLTLPTKRIV